VCSLKLKSSEMADLSKKISIKFWFWLTKASETYKRLSKSVLTTPWEEDKLQLRILGGLVVHLQARMMKMQKLRQVFREHRSNAINSVGNTVGPAYGTHRNHTLKQEAGCCKTSVPVMKDEEKYKDQQLDAKQAQTSFPNRNRWLNLGLWYRSTSDKHRGNSKWTAGGVRQQPEPRVEMPRAVGNALVLRGLERGNNNLQLQKH